MVGCQGKEITIMGVICKLQRGSHIVSAIETRISSCILLHTQFHNSWLLNRGMSNSMLS